MRGGWFVYTRVLVITIYCACSTFDGSSGPCIRIFLNFFLIESPRREDVQFCLENPHSTPYHDIFTGRILFSRRQVGDRLAAVETGLEIPVGFVFDIAGAAASPTTNQKLWSRRRVYAGLSQSSGADRGKIEKDKRKMELVGGNPSVGEICKHRT